MQNIHVSGITREEYTNRSHGRTMHILFHKQAVYERNTKWKKGLLDNYE